MPEIPVAPRLVPAVNYGDLGTSGGAAGIFPALSLFCEHARFCMVGKAKQSTQSVFYCSPVLDHYNSFDTWRPSFF